VPVPDGAEDGLNQQIMDALIELVKQFGALGQAVGARFGLSGSDVMALHKIDAPIAMKDLSARLGCDASYITVIADSLEKRGIATREPSQRDRRIKNLMLTEQGKAVRDQIISEVTAQMPWSNALDTNERQCLLNLLHKMAQAMTGTVAGAATGGDRVTSA
jgi:DNA-binding MarR family transcriptional regulator